MAHLGIYGGVVMNNGDPMAQGRVQVRVPSVLGGAGSWAMPCREFGSKAVPPIGTTVWVMFENGDVNHPVWIGCAS